MFIMRVGNETRKKYKIMAQRFEKLHRKKQRNKSDYRLIQSFNYKKAITKLF